MSCTYADGLSPYENKGVLGIPEKFDKEAEVHEKCVKLAEWLREAKHVVVHTGAGISTTAGIPDFRGPKGVWTLEQRGEKPKLDISFNEAVPTKTHMALRALIDHGYVHYVVSQNIDGLHLKSGLKRQHLAELHGNMFIEQCNKCKRQFVRQNAAETVGQKPCGGSCPSGQIIATSSHKERACRGGVLLDNVLDWEHDLPERDLSMALMHSTLADVNITLGTTLQIIPSGNLPLKNKRRGGKLVICNLQPTKHDKKAHMLISTYVDDILVKLCKRLGVEIPDYNMSEDPTKYNVAEEKLLEWTLPARAVKDLEKQYALRLKEIAAQRKRNSSRNNNIKPTQSPKKRKVKKEEEADQHKEEEDVQTKFEEEQDESASNEESSHSD